MLHKVFYMGVLVAVAAAAVPSLHQKNPEALGALLRPFLASETDEPRSRTYSAGVARPDMPEKAEALMGRKVRVEADERGHYMADFKLNGRTMTALVDTGATYVAINRSAARRIGLQLAPSDFRYRIGTANGMTAAAAVTIDTVQIGRIYVDDVQAVVLEDRALSGTLVGLSFLNRLARFQAEGGGLLLEQ